MKRLAALALIFVATQSWAATYDIKCTSACIASDGTTQPINTILNLVSWNGTSPYTPTDASGNAAVVTLVLDSGGIPYAPTITPPTFPISQAAIQLLAFSNGVATLQKQDGTLTNQSTGSSITGSITHAGRTTTATNYTVPLLALGGTSSTTVSAVDSVSGNAQVNDECIVVMTAGTFPPLGTGNPICQITSTGVATVKFTAFLAITSTTVTFNVFWRG